MPVKIYSKEIAEKYDAFVSRIFEGMEIQGNKENDFRVIEKPNPKQIATGLTGLYIGTGQARNDTSVRGNIQENGGNLVITYGTLTVKGKQISNNANIVIQLPVGTYVWNEYEEIYVSQDGRAFETDDFGETFSPFYYSQGKEDTTLTYNKLVRS